jgi:hypothetical protein
MGADTSEMGATDVPVIILGLDKQRKGVCDPCIETDRDGFDLA